jgi:dinuclear metal center YbgI/SA1388 family protein
MRASELIVALGEIAPPRLAENWDNIGLVVGDPAQDVSRVCLTVDYTPAVAEEVRRERCDFVVSYHPPIFQPIKRLTSDSLMFDAIRDRIGIYSPHTALDVADGGTNDVLADVLGLSQRRPLRPAQTQAKQCKLVTFVPEEHVERVSAALFDAGAGRIGDYSRCSFRSAGTGTFLGGAGTNPTVGQAGKFEQTPEIRLESVVPNARLAEVLGALRSAHPYEEPAFDLVQLAAAPENIGQGRIGSLEPAAARAEIFKRIKQGLELEHLLIAGSTDGDVSRAACCAGSCGEFLGDAIAQKCELFLTGEIRHHDALKASHAGMTVVCTLHSNSERPALKRLKQRLEARLPTLAFHLSRTDRDPFAVR